MQHIGGSREPKWAHLITTSLLVLAVLTLTRITAHAGGLVTEIKIKNPESGETAERLGNSVAKDGDTMIAGAYLSQVRGMSKAGLARIWRADGLGGWAFEAELIASDAAEDDYFGISVSISGNTAIVGANWDDDGGSGSGSAYVFTRSDGVWTEQAKLTASDAAAGDLFGRSVSISGDTVVIGAHGDDNGSVYVFTRSGGEWIQEAKLISSDTEEGDLFGLPVSVSDDTAIVGAHGDEDYTGAAYVFTRSAGVWTQQARLIASDAEERDYFGISVSVSGDTAIVGAHSDSDGGSDSGSAYVFTRSGGEWSERAKLAASDAAENSFFGNSVSLSGNTAVVGSYGDDDGGTYSGSAYIFTRSGGEWSEQAKLTASDAAELNWFGNSVSVSGDTAVVGATGDNVGGTHSGAAYIFTRSGEAWSQQAKLNDSDAAVDDLFGNSLSISGDTAVVGAYGDNNGGGSAYVFTRSNGVWTQQAKLTASDTAWGDYFGYSVSISGNTVVVGALWDDDGGDKSGSAYVFIRSDGVWTQQAKLVASDAAEYDRFGISVSVSGDTAVVGASSEEDGGTDSGSAYVFVRSDGVWSQQAKLPASNAVPLDYFGVSVSVSDDTAVVGAYGDNNGGGSAYVFTRSGGEWTQQAKLTPSDAAGNDLFGWSVSVSGDGLVVGAWGDDDGGSDSGSAYVFTRSDEVWSEQAKLTASDAAANEHFGYSVSISDDMVIVGADYGGYGGSETGSAYLFSRSDGMWSEKDKLTASDAAFNDRFGVSVSISGDLAITGAPWNNDPETDSGSAYIYVLTPATGWMGY